MRHIRLAVAQDARAACDGGLPGFLPPGVFGHGRNVFFKIGAHDRHGGGAGDAQRVHEIHLMHHRLKADAVAEIVPDIVGRDPAAAVDAGAHGAVFVLIEIILVNDITLG